MTIERRTTGSEKLVAYSAAAPAGRTESPLVKFLIGA